MIDNRKLFSIFLRRNRKGKERRDRNKRNKCELTGRYRGIWGFLGLSRLKIRDLFMEKRIYGMKKICW